MAEKLTPGGFLGPSLFGDGNGRALTEMVTNAAGSNLLAGEVVRINGDLTVTRAQSDIAANVTGFVGAMRTDTLLGAVGTLTNMGLGFVLLEPALVPVAGQPLWVSDITAGRATNIAPPLPVYVGVIKDASGYAATGGVIADIMPSFLITTSAIGTLAQTYATGAGAVDQTLIILDARGGGLVINATTPPPLNTSVTAFEIDVVGGSTNFYNRGGFDVSSAFERAANVAMVWNEVDFASSTLTITGGTIPSITQLGMVHFAAGVITSNNPQTVATAATVVIEGPPTAGAGGGATPTLMSPLALNVVTGIVSIGTGSAGAAAPVSALSISGATALTAQIGVYQSDTANAATLSLKTGTVEGLIRIYGSGFGAGGLANKLGFGPSGTANGIVIFSNSAVLAYGSGSISLRGGGYDGVAEKIYITKDRVALIGSNQIASAPGATWNGVLAQASTASIAGNTPITTAAGFNYFTVQAPTISGDTATCAITSAATLAISGPPVVGTNVTIARLWSLHVAGGNVWTPAVYSQNVRLRATDSGTDTLALQSVGGNNYIDAATGFIQFRGSAAVEIMQLSGSTLNLLLGTTTDAAASRLNVVATKTVAAASGAVWDGVKFATSTLTLTGATTPVTALAFFNVEGPSITAASAITVTDFYVQRIGVATFGLGVGPSAVSRSWSLYAEGNVRLGAGQTWKGTDVNVAGPYVVLDTDMFLEVRYTATGAIQVTLPALTGGTQLNGRLIAIKDSGYNAAANNITVAVGNAADQVENGGAGVSYTINVSGTCLWLKANTTTNNWEIV
jgi:hypothetical protein